MGWSVVSFFPCWVRCAGLLCPFFLAGYSVWSVVSSLRTVGWSVVSDRRCPVAAQGVMVLRWLEQHRRVVVNGAAAAELEGSKALQYMTAIKHGIGVPRSLVTVRPTAEVQRWGWGGVEREREGGRENENAFHRAGSNCFKKVTNESQRRENLFDVS